MLKIYLLLTGLCISHIVQSQNCNSCRRHKHHQQISYHVDKDKRKIHVLNNQTGQWTEKRFSTSFDQLSVY